MVADPEAPARDSVLGIRRRSPPAAAEKAASEKAAPEKAERPASRTAEARAEKRDATEKDKEAAPAAGAPKLGNATADQLLANILRSAEAAAPYMKGKYVRPFPEEYLAYEKTHGWYMGDGKGERKIKVGSQLAAVVYAIPTPWQFSQEKIPAPVLTEDGFDVVADLNKIGFSYHYVAFKLGEGQQPPQPKGQRGAANRESGNIAGLKRRRQT
jgi:hypothetical protein